MPLIFKQNGVSAPVSTIMRKIIVSSALVGTSMDRMVHRKCSRSKFNVTNDDVPSDAPSRDLVLRS